MLNSKYKPKSQKYKLSMCLLKNTNQLDPNSKSNIIKKTCVTLIYTNPTHHKFNLGESSSRWVGSKFNPY